MMTTTEAATELGVTRRRIIKLIALGRLRAIKPGRDWQVSAASVDEFKRSERKAGRPKTTPEVTPGGSVDAIVRSEEGRGDG